MPTPPERGREEAGLGGGGRAAAARTRRPRPGTRPRPRAASSGRAQCAGSARMPSARAVLPATGIGSGRPGKASCALMTFEAESPILGPAMGLERSWRALLAAESMGGVSVPRADLHAWLSLRGKVSRVREAARAKNYAGWAPPQGVRVPPVSPPSRPVFRVPRKGLAKQGFQSVSRAQSTTEQKREISVCIKRQRARRKADCKKMDGWMDG